MTEQPDDPLERSIKLRVPLFEKGTPPRTKIEELESYMMLSAYVQGDLAEDRLRCHDRVVAAERRWDEVKGESYFIGKDPKTEAAREREKRDEDPEAWEELRKLKGRIARLSEEIERMAYQEVVCSRAYTFIAG